MSDIYPPMRILIVDDSAVIRSVISRTLKEHADMNIVGLAIDGQMAVDKVKELKPDIVILDIEMPVMDGITALPLILQASPQTQVLICSALSERGADISIRALSLGAIECILKPSSGSVISAQDFQNKLISTIRSIAPTPIEPIEFTPSASTTPSTVAPASTTSTTISLRNDPTIPSPQILAIGSSTGGPKVLMDILKDLQELPFPIVITQHMPKTFTTLLAEHITKNCGLPCSEGKEGEILKSGHAYVAPGEYHMTFKSTSLGTIICLNQEPFENFCRPSVDPMFRSLIAIYGKRTLGLILTGMGQDGLLSCTVLIESGGQIAAQNQKTSAVWGMPGAVAKAGLCSAVLPVNEIAQWVQNTIKG